MSAATATPTPRRASRTGVGDALLGAARLLRLELRRSVLLWLVPLIALATAYASRDYAMSFDTVPTWLYTSAGIGWSTIFLGPMLAAVACWAAGRDARRGIGDLLATTATASTRRELVGWGAVVLWGLAAYALMGGLLVWFTDVWGAWGRPQPELLAAGAAVVVLAVTSGYVLGTLFSWRLLPPLVGVGAYPLLLLQEDSRFRDWQQLGPASWLRPSDYSVLYRVVPLPLGDLLLWLGGLTLALLALLGLRRREWPSVLLLGAAMLLAGSGATQLVDLRPRFGYSTEDVASFTPTCVSAPFTICSHPAYADVLPENSVMVAQLLEPLQGIPGVPTRIEQRGHGYGITPDGTLLVQWIGRHPDQLALTVAQEVTQASDRPVDEATWAAAWQAQAVVEAWLLERIGYDASMHLRQQPWGQLTYVPQEQAELRLQAALERFSALDAATQRAWLAANVVALRNGEITLEDLP